AKGLSSRVGAKGAGGFPPHRMAGTCRRNGSRTRRLGLPGRTTRTTGLASFSPVPGATPTPCAPCTRRQRCVFGSTMPRRNNGAGLLLTPEACLLSPVQERNPGLTPTDLEQVFADYLGIRKILWLGDGIAGDDTHGHVDDLARFVAPRTVVAVVEPNPADPNH